MATGTTEQKKILVVEDDPWTRTTEVALLAGEGYAVVEARTGEEALRLARQHRPEVVLLDLALPTQSGLEVLRELKRDVRTRDIRVLVVSAYGDMMPSGDLRRADGVVSKPFDYDTLLADISARLNPSVKGSRHLTE